VSNRFLGRTSQSVRFDALIEEKEQLWFSHKARAISGAEAVNDFGERDTFFTFSKNQTFLDLFKFPQCTQNKTSIF